MLADERIEGVEPTIPLGKRFWPLTSEERLATDTLFREEKLRLLATSLRAWEDGASIRGLDVAYWRKGCSPLGRLRMAVLVAVGKGKAERHCLPGGETNIRLRPNTPTRRCVPTARARIQACQPQRP